MKKISCFFSCSILLLIFLIIDSGCTGRVPEEESEPPEIAETNPYRGDAAAIEEGKKLFGAKCGQCHGPDAGGGPDAPDLVDEETMYGSTDGDAFRIVYYGTPNGMPTWKKELGIDDIWKVLAYVDSLR